VTRRRGGGALLVAVVVAMALGGAGVVGCSSDTKEPNRPGTLAEDGGGPDADAAMPEAAPNGGRDDNASSCFAACQNSGFTCQAKGDSTIVTVEMLLDPKGCTGTLTTGSTTPTESSVAITIECAKGEICRGASPGAPADLCVSGLFSAFSFSYVPSAGAPENVCTRN
jgi:hypothetical protein